MKEIICLGEMVNGLDPTGRVVVVGTDPNHQIHLFFFNGGNTYIYIYGIWLAINAYKSVGGGLVTKDLLTYQLGAHPPSRG